MFRMMIVTCPPRGQGVRAISTWHGCSAQNEEARQVVDHQVRRQVFLMFLGLDAGDYDDHPQ